MVKKAGASTKRPQPSGSPSEPNDKRMKSEAQALGASSSSAASSSPHASLKFMSSPEYMDRVVAAKLAIESQWPGISIWEPIAIEDGGFATPFSREDYGNAWDRGSTYSCGINLMWVSFMRCPLPHVPVYSARVEELLSHVQPGVLKHSVVLRSSWSADDLIPLGEIQHISPTEFLHAILLKIADAIHSGEDASVLDAWKNWCLAPRSPLPGSTRTSKCWPKLSACARRQRATGMWWNIQRGS